MKDINSKEYESIKLATIILLNDCINIYREIYIGGGILFLSPDLKNIIIYVEVDNIFRE